MTDEPLPAVVAPTARAPNPGKRAGFISMVSLGTGLRDFAFYVGRVLTRSGTYRVQGGGASDAVISQFFYVLYLRELILDLSSFETDDDEDYQYYEALARMVLSITTNKARMRDLNFFNTMQHILYDILPVGGWTEAEELAGTMFMRNSVFADRVSFIGRQVALHCFNLKTGPLESLGNTGSIPVDAVKVFNDLKVFLRGKSFNERKAFLLKELGVRMDFPDPAQAQGVNLRRTPVSLQTGQLAPISKITMAPKGITVGGRRTRKNKKINSRKSKKNSPKNSVSAKKNRR